MGGNKNIAACFTVLLCFFIVILPVATVVTSVLSQGSQIYEQILHRQIDLVSYYHTAIGKLPAWGIQVLDRVGLTDISTLVDRLTNGAMDGSGNVAKQVVSVGQNTIKTIVSFGIMLYLLFYLLRDGAILAVQIREAIPLSPEYKRHFLNKFVTVIRATVRGSIAIAAAQGILGGAIFWFLGISGALLWGTVMAFLSLLPAIGAWLVWAPIAAYFLFAGPAWKGGVLIVFGIGVIGVVDNILRPLLVSKDARMPNYVVLVSTLGGMTVLGLNGFVIGPTIAALFIASWDLLASRAEAPPSE
jgi:predicted PurR-regulated permease PerM